MHTSTDLPNRTFFGRALDRIALVFNARHADATTNFDANSLAGRGDVDRTASSTVINLADAARAIGMTAHTNSMIGFAIVEGALARLPFYDQSAGPVTLPTPPVAAPVAVTGLERPASPYCRLDALLPKPRATPPALIKFLPAATAPIVEPVAPLFETHGSIDLDHQPAATAHLYRPLAAQLRATAQLNKPRGRIELAAQSTQGKRKSMPKTAKAAPKKATPRRQMVLILRAPKDRPAAALPAVAKIEPAKAKSTTTALTVPRRIDFSIPAVRGALRLERAGRNEIVSLPMAA